MNSHQAYVGGFCSKITELEDPKVVLYIKYIDLHISSEYESVTQTYLDTGHPGSYIPEIAMGAMSYELYQSLFTDRASLQDWWVRLNIYQDSYVMDMYRLIMSPPKMEDDIGYAG